MMRGRRFTPFERAGLALAAAVVVAPVVLDGLRPDAAGDSIPGGEVALHVYNSSRHERRPPPAAAVTEPYDAVERARADCRMYYDAATTWKRLKRRPPNSFEDMAAPLEPGEEDFVRVEDDPWGSPYQLERDENRIRIRSLGPDALEGTDDDVVYPRDR
jgi:hypothetical protein